MNTSPIIVGGFYRSGTSLLRRLLDSHSQIHCGPEVKFFKDLYGDYLNDSLGHVRLFSTLPSLGLEQDEVLDVFGAAFITAHELAARRAGKMLWADKNPENVLYLNQWRRLLPGGFYFIHVVRHPLDVLASLLEIGFEKAVPPAFEDKVRLLNEFVRAGAEYEARYPEASTRVCYEDLVQEPERVLGAVFSRLGILWEPQIQESFYKPERGTGIEDPKVALTRSIHGDSVNRWRSDLNHADIDVAVNILGEDFFGYKLHTCG